jgi:hypothetical protein
LIKPGLCVTLVVEVALIRLGAAADDLTKPFWVVSKVLLLRSAFLAAAAAQILHAIFAFKYGGPSNHDLQSQRHSTLVSSDFPFLCCRDYDVLNHELLQTLVEKVRAIEDNAAGELLSVSSAVSCPPTAV